MLLRLLPMSDHGNDAEILALRRQLMVLEHQLGKERARFAPGDRAFLAALLHRLPRGVLRQVRLLVRPDTVLRRHRDLLARRHAACSRPKRSGRGEYPKAGVPLSGKRMQARRPAFSSVTRHRRRRVLLS
ncbi:hypothetical protein [Streptomyces sp. bgisy034]|uniref:hypothetical protein n=1 Tax=Streptomyces sp. bgisy034 TaxID=3413774 RepID=UPI003EB93D9C